MTRRLNTPDDFATLKEAGLDRPLEPGSPEDLRLQEKMNNLTSYNLAQLARQLHRARLALFDPNRAA